MQGGSVPAGFPVAALRKSLYGMERVQPTIVQEVEGEIDLILEENGTLHPVEIKLTGSPRVTDTAAFQVIDAVVGKKRGEGAVVCMCPTVGQLKDDLRVEEELVDGRALPSRPIFGIMRKHEIDRRI